MRVTGSAFVALLGFAAAKIVGAAELRATVTAEDNDAKALALKEFNGRRLHDIPEGFDMEGIENLQDMFFENNGRYFSLEELQEAIAKAHMESGNRGDEGFPTNRHLYVRDMPEHERRRHLEEHKAREESNASRRMQNIRQAQGFFVTSQSPGFSWNEGRNDFLCASVQKIARNQRNTPRRQTLTLKNCYTTPQDEILTDYTAEQELWMFRIDNVFYNWCLETEKIRRNQPVRLNHCDVYNENQVWEVRSTDQTWRPSVDPDLCVTCNSKDCEKGGGKLKYKPCASELRGQNGYRNGQAWVFCFIGTSCAIGSPVNTGKIDCNIAERCGSKGLSSTSGTGF